MVGCCWRLEGAPFINISQQWRNRRLRLVLPARRIVQRSKACSQPTPKAVVVLNSLQKVSTIVTWRQDTHLVPYVPC